ncbi:MAG TPA: S-methyl-5'-thioadenosine phosphorylase [Kiritimatiellia bacterium]|nr:S-methyl-5'-thioadenosine phosphorylase [Kiritimatiellia bacterium]
MRLGIIGGSGLYEMDDLTDVRPIHVPTPFGEPSDDYIRGVLGQTEIIFLPRHGKGHRILPAEINHRANIFGFKTLGVDRIIAVSAVGSLREEVRPRDIFLPDQYFDRTKGSLNHTFFGRGIAAHVGFGEPVCAKLRSSLRELSTRVIEEHKAYRGIQVHDRGTYVNMEGPAFSTKAESDVYRKMGFDIIGMTSLPEAKLCREAEICYASIAMVTDYDCWREDDAPVTVEMVIANLKANANLSKDLLRKLAQHPPKADRCACHQALENAIITHHDAIPADIKKTLAPIIGKYIRA